MRPFMGLHAQEEVRQAEMMANEAFDMAVRAHDRRDAVAMAFEIGYIKAIADLALKEGSHSLETMARGLLRRLDIDFRKLLSEKG